jgi:hypothetical protein
LEQALNTAGTLLDTLERVLVEPTSESGIRALVKIQVPSQTLPGMLTAISEMADRLQNADVRTLYRQLHTVEAQTEGREVLARYVAGQTSYSDLVTEFQELLRREAKPSAREGGDDERIPRLALTVRFGQLRAAFEGVGIQPESGWDVLGNLASDTEVIVEVRRNAES